MEGIFNARKLVRETRHRHAHPRRTYQAREEDEQVGMTTGEVFPYLLSNGDEEDTGDRVADKCRDNLRTT